MYVNLYYQCAHTAEVPLPKSKTVDDIESLDARWSMLFITFKDGTKYKHDMDPAWENEDFSCDGQNFKFPINIETFEEEEM